MFVLLLRVAQIISVTFLSSKECIGWVHPGWILRTSYLRFGSHCLCLRFLHSQNHSRGACDAYRPVDEPARPDQRG